VKLSVPWRNRVIAFGSAAAVALVVMLVAPHWLHGVSRVVAAYDAAALSLIVFFWTVAIQADPERTKSRAALEDPGRNVVLAIVLASVTAGLGSAVAVLGRGPKLETPNEKTLAYGLAVGAVVLGWLVIHTMFTFRYAHLYYYDDDDDNEADRGLTFPGGADPSDFDFAYFAFVIGMTFQVSDVQVTDRRVRRVVLFHGLISFAYSTMILALAINIVSGLLH
jgi:uncharacterized membrane protein